MPFLFYFNYNAAICEFQGNKIKKCHKASIQKLLRFEFTYAILNPLKFAHGCFLSKSGSGRKG
jgi:hypothetical protein